MRGLLLLLALCAGGANTARAQYPPQAGLPGSDAIPTTSPAIVGWATGCTVQRGWKDIADPTLGYTTTGDSAAAIGAPDGAVLSLGDSGVATLTFVAPVFDAPGPDFAVFENGFLNPEDGEEAFLELAFVEVSSDGLAFVRFPASCLVPDTPQLSSVAGAGYINARELHNLAGKHIAGWGTPFDLAELSGTPGLDVLRITHVRLVDVVGSVSAHAGHDAADAVVNDPYPTPFPTGGFDLDAVTVLHSAVGIREPSKSDALRVWPVPARASLFIEWPGDAQWCRAAVIDGSGRTIFSGKVVSRGAALDVQSLAAGPYFLLLTFPDGRRVARRFTKA